MQSASEERARRELIEARASAEAELLRAQISAAEVERLSCERQEHILGGRAARAMHEAGMSQQRAEKLIETRTS